MTVTNPWAYETEQIKARMDAAAAALIGEESGYCGPGYGTCGSLHESGEHAHDLAEVALTAADVPLLARIADLENELRLTEGDLSAAVHEATVARHVTGQQADQNRQLHARIAELEAVQGRVWALCDDADRRSWPDLTDLSTNEVRRALEGARNAASEERPTDG